MTEKTLVNAIMCELRKRGFYVIKIHGGAYQQPGLPDLWAVKDGRLFCFEVKLPHGKVTPIQQRELARLRRAGAVAAVVRSVDDAVQQVLSAITSGPIAT